MRTYQSKQELVNEIRKQADLFIGEFSAINESNKDLAVDGVDRTPAQMIVYQLGWMNLLLSWEHDEQDGHYVQTPHADYRWNNLGGLYQHFYDTYADKNLSELVRIFYKTLDELCDFVANLSDAELIEPGGRKWAASTPANWPVWKWVHINTVAPFKTFRGKIRKWKKVKSESVI